MCATNRGRLILEKIQELAPRADLTVFSFREEPWEPPFLEDIKTITLNSGGNFFESRNVGSQSYADIWGSADIALAVSWRYMIPSDVYNLPRIGTFVFHDSLLPAYRGFSPTVWAMINGEKCTGVTLFKIAQEVDAGDIVDQEEVPIGADEVIADVVDNVTQTYISVLDRNFEKLVTEEFQLQEQDHSKATYTCKRLPQDNLINWHESTNDIYNFIRALSQPYPGAYSFLDGEKLVVWSGKEIQLPEYTGKVPGRVVQVLPGRGTVVLTGDGALLIKTVQRESGEIECAADILNRLNQTLLS
jgi:methionyl-tRNA formyltransferase